MGVFKKWRDFNHLVYSPMFKPKQYPKTVKQATAEYVQQQVQASLPEYVEEGIIHSLTFKTKRISKWINKHYGEVYEGSRMHKGTASDLDPNQVNIYLLTKYILQEQYHWELSTNKILGDYWLEDVFISSDDPSPLDTGRAFSSGFTPFRPAGLRPQTPITPIPEGDSYKAVLVYEYSVVTTEENGQRTVTSTRKRDSRSEPLNTRTERIGNKTITTETFKGIYEIEGDYSQYLGKEFGIRETPAGIESDVSVPKTYERFENFIPPLYTVIEGKPITQNQNKKLIKQTKRYARLLGFNLSQLIKQTTKQFDEKQGKTPQEKQQIKEAKEQTQFVALSFGVPIESKHEEVACYHFHFLEHLYQTNGGNPIELDLGIRINRHKVKLGAITREVSGTIPSGFKGTYQKQENALVWTKKEGSQYISYRVASIENQIEAARDKWVNFSSTEKEDKQISKDLHLPLSSLILAKVKGFNHREVVVNASLHIEQTSHVRKKVLRGWVKAVMKFGGLLWSLATSLFAGFTLAGLLQGLLNTLAGLLAMKVLSRILPGNLLRALGVALAVLAGATLTGIVNYSSWLNRINLIFKMDAIHLLQASNGLIQAGNQATLGEYQKELSWLKKRQGELNERLEQMGSTLRVNPLSSTGMFPGETPQEYLARTYSFLQITDTAIQYPSRAVNYLLSPPSLSELLV